MRSHSRCRVLYVSDSLGTPIHPRGIFNYSVSVLEILRSLGMEVTLAVEGTPGYGGYGIRGRMAEDLARIAPRALDSMRLAEIYRYFSGSRFSHRFEYRQRAMRVLAKHAAGLVAMAQRQLATVKPARPTLVPNETSLLSEVPKAAEHLLLADRLLVVDELYSASMLRAVNRTGPVPLDATGYDIVLVDTPHYVEITGARRDQIISVVHDLIPLQDVQMSSDWRLLFQSKLDVTLKNSGHLIFVSEATRDTFNNLFPERANTPNTILYPAIRSGLLASAEEPAERGSEHLETIGARIRTSRIERNADQISDSVLIALALGQVSKADLRASLTKGSDWDPSLPFFATAVSDEPRKNIAIFVEAAEALRGLANLVVMGQVDGNRYMGHQPERYPNLHFTGYVTETEKLNIIRGSTGLIFPSFSEGFGIPVVEGAVFGRPVICSNIPVFREITGGLAVYIDPHRPDELVSAVRDIISNPAEATARAAPLQALCLSRYRQTAMAERLKQTLVTMGRLKELDQAA